MARENCRETYKHRNLHIAPIAVAFWFAMFLNLELSGKGLDVDFCFDASEEDSRLDTEVIKHVHAMTAVDCIVQCLLQDESCRSVNFRKNQTCGEQNNCELLNTVNSEEPDGSLKRDENFDYYIMVKPNRKPEKATTLPTSTTVTARKTTDNLIIQPTSTATSSRKKTDDSNATIQPTSTAIYSLTKTDDSSSTIQQPTSTATSTPKKTGDSTIQPTSTATSTLKNTDDSTIQPTSTATSTLKKTDDSIIQPTSTANPSPKMAHDLTTDSTGKTASTTSKSSAQPNDQPANQPKISGSCENEDWSASFNSRGWSNCSSAYPYIKGLYGSKSRNISARERWSRKWDGLYHLEKANCCEGFENIKSLCVEKDWTYSFDRNNDWNLCTQGYYLSGLYRSDNHHLENTEKARCCKPHGAPHSNMTCYDEDVLQSFNWDRKGWASCTKAGYYITGLYKSNCDTLSCIHKLKCCKL